MNAARWVGYKEHLTPERLTHFTANIGKGGCTIFAAMIWAKQHRNLMGFPWCVTFVHAVIDRPDILGKAHPGSRVLMRRMKRKGLWRDTDYIPKENDLIFCANDEEHIDHVGIVLSADGESVTSIDGNTHDQDKVFRWEDGGAVAIITRDHNSSTIKGYAAIGKLLKGDI